MNIPTVATPTYSPITKYLTITHLVSRASSLNKNLFYLLLGGLVIMFFSFGLKPRAVAGGPSVTRFTLFKFKFTEGLISDN